MPLIIFLIISLFTLKPTIAIEEFTTNQSIFYKIDQGGNATVSHEINLTNNYSQIYAKEYQIQISNHLVENIIANDKNGDILKKIEKSNNQTIIFLNFNNPSIGKDNTTTFKVNYIIKALLKTNGNTREISVPQHTSTCNSCSTNITISVPKILGNPSFSSIPISNLETTSKELIITYHQSREKKIFLTFGNYQLFDFTLKYFLKNTTTSTAIYEIAIPPDSNNQKVLYKDINPAPETITSDPDGNWLAKYLLNPSQEIAVNIQGQAKIFLPKTVTEEIDDKTYLLPQKFWPTTDPQIQATIKDLNTPKQIYDFVVSTLSYDYSGINSAERKGATNALALPNNSLCTEFTDLFITLARAKNIPAREIEGFAYTSNSRLKPINPNADILHAWPQYFDQKKRQWVSIDPTWGKTTNGIDYFSELDLNHFTFVVHGKDSQYPPPPGSYKNNYNLKTVSVEFAKEQLITNILPPQIKVSNNLTIYNPNLSSLENVTVALKNTDWTSNTKFIPPLGSVVINLPPQNLFHSLLPQNNNLEFRINFNDNPSSVTLLSTNRTHFFNLTILIIILILIFCLGGIILITSKPKHHEKTA